MKPPVAHGLSKLQGAILRSLWHVTTLVEAEVEGAASSDHWGIPWHPRGNAPRWTASNRAAVSRALRRLEQRGLLVRMNRTVTIGVSDSATGGPPRMASRRTSEVRLTELGRAVAQRFTANVLTAQGMTSRESRLARA